MKIIGTAPTGEILITEVNDALRPFFTLYIHIDATINTSIPRERGDDEYVNLYFSFRKWFNQVIPDWNDGLNDFEWRVV